MTAANIKIKFRCWCPYLSISVDLCVNDTPPFRGKRIITDAYKAFFFSSFQSCDYFKNDFDWFQLNFKLPKKLANDLALKLKWQYSSFCWLQTISIGYKCRLCWKMLSLLDTHTVHFHLSPHFTFDTIIIVNYCFLQI